MSFFANDLPAEYRASFIDPTEIVVRPVDWKLKLSEDFHMKNNSSSTWSTSWGMGCGIPSAKKN